MNPLPLGTIITKRSWVSARNVLRSGVKILVKSVRTGLFLNRAGGWTASAKDAIDFPTTVAAYDHCSHHRYTGTATVVRFQNRRHDIEFRHP